MFFSLDNKMDTSKKHSVFYSKQRTIAHPVSCRGIGLHTGKTITISFFPASYNTGIIFERLDLEENNLIKTDPYNVIEALYCTKIENSYGASVSTIEHVMAAIAACEVDNIHIEIDGPEVPILDGSSIDFMNLLESAHFKEQNFPRQAIKILKPLLVKEENRFVTLEPADGFSIHYSIDFFGRQGLEAQQLHFDGSFQTFREDFARARTYGFYEDAQKLFKASLSLGASLENTVVIDNGHIMNKEGLRYSNEFVRHKILDALGDLYVIGHPIIGSYKAHNGGHSLNNRLLKALIEDQSAWCFEKINQSLEWHPDFYTLPLEHPILA